jgi:lipoprotein signal peptidase
MSIRFKAFLITLAIMIVLGLLVFLIQKWAEATCLTLAFLVFFAGIYGIVIDILKQQD